MFNFLHNFNPQPILWDFEFFQIHWYGLILVLAMVIGIALAVKIAKHYDVKEEATIDLAFWLIIFGLVGARLYEVFLNFSYYYFHPIDIFKIWQGGLAIHGAILAGLLVIWRFSHSRALSFWLTASIIAPALALAQAIGRWGNYFNQELFGLPTSLPFGIPIDFINRPEGYLSFEYFHPTFLYESIGCLLICFILLIIHYSWKALGIKKFVLISSAYIFLYSLLRFCLEFIKVDYTPMFLGLRWPQIASILLEFMALLTVFFYFRFIKTRPQP